MHTRSLLLILLTCLQLISGFSVLPNRARNNDKVYASDDYYLFAREWPPTACLTKTCNYMENFDGSTLNIHGLWYQGGPDSKCIHPGNCLNISFDSSSLTAATKSELARQWVGVFNSSDSFHDHQWTKHGTCYEKDITSSNGLRADPYQEKFFALAVSLNTQNNAIAKFRSAGITPSASKGYTVESLYDAMGASKANSLLACRLLNSKYYLNSHYLCMDKQFAITNCPCAPVVSSGEVACPTGQSIFIPPL